MCKPGGDTGCEVLCISNRIDCNICCRLLSRSKYDRNSFSFLFYSLPSATETRIATVCPRVSSVTGDVFIVGGSVLGLFCVTVADCTDSCDPGGCLTKERTIVSLAVAFKLCEAKELLP